jgi:cell division protein FtsQ
MKKNRYKQLSKKGRPGKKDRPGKKRRYLPIFKISGVVLSTIFTGMVFIFIHDAITQCHYFEARQIHISGNNQLKTEQILHQAGISRGMNILSTNLTVARKRLLAQPWIWEASVSRQLPSGISIEIEEHIPMAVVDLGKRYLMDTRGKIFKQWTAGDPHTLPLIQGLDYRDISVSGEAPSPPYESVITLLNLDHPTGSKGARQTITTINVDRELGLSLHLAHDVGTVKLGYGHYSDKLKNLDNIMAHLATKKGFSKIESIDLTSAGRIVINPGESDPSDGNRKEA